MQMEMLRCYVKPATVFPSPDKRCAGSTASSVTTSGGKGFNLKNCFGDPKCSGRDSVGMRAFRESWHFRLVQCEKAGRITIRPDSSKMPASPTPRSTQTKTQPSPNGLCKSPISIFLFLNASPHAACCFQRNKQQEVPQGQNLCSPSAIISNSSVIQNSIMGYL